MTDRTCQKRFPKFRAGDSSLDRAPRSGGPADVDSDPTGTLTENSQRSTMWDIDNVLKIPRSMTLSVKMTRVSFILREKPYGLLGRPSKGTEGLRGQWAAPFTQRCGVCGSRAFVKVKKPAAARCSSLSHRLNSNVPRFSTHIFFLFQGPVPGPTWRLRPLSPLPAPVCGSASVSPRLPSPRSLWSGMKVSHVVDAPQCDVLQRVLLTRPERCIFGGGHHRGDVPSM